MRSELEEFMRYEQSDVQMFPRPCAAGVTVGSSRRSWESDWKRMVCPNNGRMETGLRSETAAQFSKHEEFALFAGPLIFVRQPGHLVETIESRLPYGSPNLEDAIRGIWPVGSCSPTGFG